MKETRDAQPHSGEHESGCRASEPRWHFASVLSGWRWEPASLATRLFGLTVVLVLGIGCPCLRGPVNASPALRWWLFSNFGAQQVCPEMLKRGAPLKLSPNGNTVGRFFPSRCHHEVNDQTQTITVHFTGTGFAWTPVAGRIGFQADASVEYRMDFFLGEEAVYIWAKTNRIVHGPEFQIGSIENKVVDWVARTPAGYMAQTFGTQIVQSQLASGFTVVRTDDGDEFTIGHLQPPQRPRKPFDTSAGDRYVFANETTEIRANQIDMLGPFEVADDDQALFLRMVVTGPGLDVMVYHRGVGDLSRNGLQIGQALAPPPQPPLSSFALNPGPEMRQRIKLPRGQYYVVIDNSAQLGTVMPPWNPLGVVGGNVAVLSYTAELGEDDDQF